MKKTINILFVILLCCTFLPIGIAQSLEDKFQEILDTTYQSNPDAVGVLFHVESPDKNISWTSAVGFANKQTKQIINKNQPALVASNTKTYVAVATVKLIEMGKFTLDDPIKKLIKRKTRRRLQKDGYQLDKITIRHLLSHTSGIADYVDDAYFEFVNKNPQHKWTRNEQIKRTVAIGNPSEIGKNFKYADINFVLLTEVIERKTKKPFYTAIRELLEYKKHQLNATWFANLEEHPKGVAPLVHQYWNKYDWDSYNLNPSWDLYGGGGIISTTKDLALFFQLLFEGKIIKDKALLAELTTFVLPKEESIYCLGLRKLSFHGMEAYYHGGFWGTDVMYLPELNATISAFTLQRDKRGLNAEISNAIMQILKRG